MGGNSALYVPDVYKRQALTTFMLSSYVIPKGSVTRLHFEDRYIKPKKQNTARNVQLEVDSGVIRCV